MKARISLWSLIDNNPIVAGKMASNYSDKEVREAISDMVSTSRYSLRNKTNAKLFLENIRDDKYKISRYYDTHTDVHIIIRDCNEFIYEEENLGLNNRCNFYLDFDFDPIELLKHGLLPNLDVIKFYGYEKFIIAVKEDIPEDVMVYFHEDKPRLLLKNIRLWTMLTLDAAKEYILENNSIPFIFSYPELLYESNRPNNDMSLYRTSNSLTGTLDNYYNDRYYRLTIDKEEYEIFHVEITGNKTYSINKKLAIPVVRYATDVSVGLYYPDKSTYALCGTFYYYEPESTTYLIVRDGNVLIAKTKTSAAIELLRYKEDAELRGDLEFVTEREDVRNYERGIYREDMRYTAVEAYEELDIQSSLGINPYDIEDYPMYIGSSSALSGNTNFLYASEDGYDQSLCRVAKELGYDLVILTNMIGMYQVVTEILDTRDRSNSFRNLVYT